MGLMEARDMGVRHRLALVLMDENDVAGDECGLPEDSMVPELTASILHVQHQRLRGLEKSVKRLESCPEIAAMLARMDTRSLYGA